MLQRRTWCEQLFVVAWVTAVCEQGWTPVILLLICRIFFLTSICSSDEHGYQEGSRRDGIREERRGAKSRQEKDVGEPLFLTPLIEAGKYKEALRKSKVGKIGDLPDILSYSGYITVDKELNSSLFFWFFPAMENPENAPVSLWLQGGTRHVLYVCFTDSTKGYSRNQTDVSRNMLEMLQQFFTLFKDYASNDFYLSGESYAGKYVPSIGAALHESRGKLRVPINFKGVAIGNGMIDPITMLVYGDFLYNIGLMDRDQATHMQQECNRTASLLREKKYLQATALAYSIILGVVPGASTYFGNVTGYKYGYNYLLTEKPEEHTRYKSFVATPAVRRAIHVGDRTYNTNLENVAVFFASDLMQSVRDKLTLLLDNSYKALLYSGHLDIIVTSTATEALMYSLEWSGSEEWSEAQQKIWRSSDGERVHGYVKRARNATMVVVRNAGHITPYDQPGGNENPETAPVSLWLQGGPGTSSFEGLFVEHGPYYLDENLEPRLRDITWTRTISMLYVDNPVGTGFSFTESDEGYATDQDDVSRDMVEMLQQFFTLFSEYASNDFYLSGESYAGKYIPSIGALLHESRDQLRVPINFKGIAVGNGMTDPITMLKYGDFLYDIGLLDRREASYMQEQCDRVVSMIRDEEYLNASLLSTELILGTVAGTSTLFGNVTGYEYCYNYLLTEKPESHSRYQTFLKTPTAREALHTGHVEYDGTSTEVALYLATDLMKSVKDELALLADNYKVLMYSGHLDIIVTSVATETLMYTMQWSGSEEWANAEKKIWRSHDGERVQGYAKNVKNCTFVIVRDGGHILPYDQPVAAYDMITRYFNNEPFA
ncbi:hypothetical protein MTO96_008545 [Rhipicephalus appendiculatus]